MSQPNPNPWGNSPTPQNSQQPQPTQPFTFPQPGQVQPPAPGYYQQPTQQQPYYQQPVYPAQQPPNQFPQVGYFGGEPEPKKGMPWWGTAIILVLALSIVVAIGAAFRASAPTTATQANEPQIVATSAPAPTAITNNNSGKTGTGAGVNSNQSTVPTAIPTVRTIPTPTAIVPKVVRGKIGDTLTQNGYVITVNSAEKSESYNKFITPKDGFIYLAVDITVQSDKNEDVSSSIVQASLKDGQGFKYDATFAGKDPQLASQNNIPKGEKVRGWVTFEVPKTAKGFTLEYEGLFELSNPTLISFTLE